MISGRHRRTGSRYLKLVLGTASANAAANVISVVTGIAVARLLGSSGRGVFAAVTVYALAAAAIGECGLTSSICFHVARRPDRPARVLRTGLVVIVGLGAVTGAVGYLCAPLILHRHPGGISPLRLAFLAEPLIFAGGAWMSALQALDIRTWNLIRLTQPIFYGGLLVVVSRFRPIDVFTITVLLIGSIGAQAALAGFQARARIRGVGPGRARVDRSLLPPMLRYGLANLTARTPDLLNTRLDQLVLAIMVAPAELGRYAVAVSLSLISYPVATAFGSVALPRIAADNDRGAAVGQGMLRSALLGSLGIGTVSCLILCAAAPVVVPVLLGPTFTGVVPLMWVLAPGAVVFGCNKVVGDILRGFNKSTTVARCQGAATFVTVPLLAILVPRLGVMGAAIASTAAYGLAFGLLLRALLSTATVSPAAVVHQTRYLARSAVRRSLRTLGPAQPPSRRGARQVV